MQSLASFFLDEPEDAGDNTRKYIEKLSRILQSKDFAAKKRSTGPLAPRSRARRRSEYFVASKPSIFLEFKLDSAVWSASAAQADGVDLWFGRYKTMDALRAQSAQAAARPADGERTRPTARRREEAKSAEELRFEVRQVQKMMLSRPVTQPAAGQTGSQSRSFRRTVQLMHTVAHVQEPESAADGKSTRLADVLREIAAVLYLCEMAGEFWGSLRNLLGHLCLFVDQTDFAMTSAIDEPTFVRFCRSQGLDPEAATLVFGLLRKETGGKPQVVVDDFMCLYKYIEKSVLEIHRWAAETKLLFPYTDDLPSIPHHSRASSAGLAHASRKSFRPVHIWLFSATPPRGAVACGHRFPVQKDLRDIRKLHADIQAHCPLAVPFGAHVSHLYDVATRRKVQHYSDLTDNGKYLVCGAHQPRWDAVADKIHNFHV